MLEQPGKVYLVIAWDRQADHAGQPLTLTSVKQTSDGEEAVDIYREASFHQTAVYLYVTDESGRMELILEHERLPGYGDPRLRSLGRPVWRPGG